MKRADNRAADALRPINIETGVYRCSNVMNSDVVSINAPLTPETHHAFDAAAERWLVERDLDGAIAGEALVFGDRTAIRSYLPNRIADDLTPTLRSSSRSTIA